VKKGSVQNVFVIFFITFIVKFGYAATWDSSVPPPFSNGEELEIRASASGMLDVPNGFTVTIVSNGEVGATANRFEINTNESGTVIWRANYRTRLGITVRGNGTFEVAAGSISALSNSAINSVGGNTIIISGGVISATGNLAIRSVGGASNTVNIAGGLVIARGTAVIGDNALNNVISNVAVQTGGALVAYPASGTFKQGSRTALLSLPENAEVSWGLNEEMLSGVRFGNLFAPTAGAIRVEQ